MSAFGRSASDGELMDADMLLGGIALGGQQPRSSIRRRETYHHHKQGTTAKSLRRRGGKGKTRTRRRSLSCPVRTGSIGIEKFKTFPEQKVVRGEVEALPVRIRTNEGLSLLFKGLLDDVEKLAKTAVIFDFDKVITNEPGVKTDENMLNLVRGGEMAVEMLKILHEHKVPLFIATARRTEKYLSSLYVALRDKSDLGYLDFFQDVNEPLASIQIETVDNAELDISVKRIHGTRIFSAGYEKGKTVAHIVAKELEPSRTNVVFIDDNVFNAYFVLQEVPEYLHKQNPQTKYHISSTWWDPSEEQSRGLMRIHQDTDFSYIKDYQQCLSTFGVDEDERQRTAEILHARNAYHSSITGN